MKSLNSILLIILSSFFFSTAASAQVTELHIGANLNSIVRNVDETTQLIYTEVSPTESYFVLYTDGQSTARVFRTPSDFISFHVYDMRIKGREAYFCGAKDGAGMIGKFNIYNVFAGTGSVEYCFLGYTHDSTVYVESLRRLELYNAGIRVCMAMVGVAKYDGMTICPVVSASLNGITWDFYTDAQKDEYRFTDITCLDDMIVATGTHLDTLCLVKTFQLAPDFPFHEYYPTGIHYLSFGSVRGNPLISKYKNDTAVLAFFDASSGIRTVLHFQPFDATTGLPIVAGSALVTVPSSSLPYGNQWDLLELATVKDSVFLLQRADNPTGAPAAIRDWRLAAHPMVPVINAWQLDYGHQHSMDVTFAKKTSSKSASDLLYLDGPSWPRHEGFCHPYEEINALMASFDNTETGFMMIPKGMSYLTRTIKPSLFTIDVKQICNQ